MVVLHGLSLDSQCSMASLEPLFTGRSGWRRIYVDLPGHGGSPAPEWILSNDDMVAALVGFLDALLPDARFTLAGHSYGAFLARGVAARIGARLDGLLLWVPAEYPRAKRRRPPAVVLRQDAAVTSRLATKEEGQTAKMAVVQDPRLERAVKELLVPAARKMNEKFVQAVCDQGLTFDPEPIPFLRPTLIVCGRQDSVVGYVDPLQLLEKYPRATLAILDGAGHMLGLSEEVDAFGALVSDWLDRVGSLQ